MATELGSAFISVGLGTNKLGAEIKQAFSGAEASGADAGKSAGRGFGGAFGVAAAAIGALGIGSFFKSAIGGAADLEQSVGAIDSVFKGSAGQMHQWAQSAATDVGLSANEFNELGTLIGSQLKYGGTAMDELAPKTQSLISTGADLASMFGGTTSEAVEALSSALKGERDPIEKYGVSLNQAKIDAEAAALGFSKVDGAFEQSAQQAATLSLITKQTADATGNFGRETDTLAHKQQVLNAQLANGKARIGTELLPVVAAFTGMLSNTLGPAINGTVTGIKTVVGGFTAFGEAFKAADGDITSSGFAGVMERLGFVASKVRDTFKTVWAGIKMPSDVADSFGDNLNPVLAFGRSIGEVADKAVFAAKTIWAGFKMPASVAASIGANINPLLSVGQTIQTAFSVVGPLFQQIGSVIAGLLPQVLALWTQFSPLAVIFKALQPVLPQLALAISALAGAMGAVLGSVLSQLAPMLGMLVETLSGVFVAIMPALTAMIITFSGALAEVTPVVMGILAAVLPLVASLIGQLAPIITSLVTAILPPLVSIFGNIVTAIAPLITQLAELLIPIIQALLPVVVTVFSVVAEVIKAAMQIVQGIIQVVTGAISGDWDRVWTGMGNILSGIWNTIVALVRGALTLIGQIVISGVTVAGQFMTSAFQQVSGFLGGIWNNIVSGAAGMIGNLIGFFSSLPGRIMGALGSMTGLLVSVGRDMIQGLINGISGMMGAIGRAVINIVPEAIRGPFESLLGIHSPSRVFREYGVNIGQGLILGIDGMHGKVANAVTGLVSVPAAPSFTAGSYTPAGAVGGVGGGGFSNYGTIQVRDENELARVMLNAQADAQAVYQ